MKKSNYLFALALGASTLTYAQVGIGTSSPSNALDIETTGPAIDINDTGGSDPVINFQSGGSTAITIGIDNDDSDKFKIGASIDANSPVTVETGGNVTINDGGQAYDFKVEGDTDTDLLTVDGSADAVGVSTSTPASGLDVQTSLGLAHTTVTTTTTLNQTHNVVLASDASGDFTITLPAAASNSGKVYYIKKTNSSENEITIDGNGGETIDGATTVVLYVQYDAIRILCDGSNWHIIDDERIPHSCSLRRNSGQTISNTTATYIDFNSEDFDVGGIGDPSTNYRIDIKRAGKYLISGYLSQTGLGDQKSLIIRIVVNGTAEQLNEETQSETNTGTRTSVSCSKIMELAANDYVELTIYQDSGGDVTTTSGSSQLEPTLSVAEIR